MPGPFNPELAGVLDASKQSRLRVLKLVAVRARGFSAAEQRRGGKNSRKNLTPEQRTELARRAVSVRWEKRKAAAKQEK